MPLLLRTGHPSPIDLASLVLGVAIITHGEAWLAHDDHPGTKFVGHRGRLVFRTSWQCAGAGNVLLLTGPMWRIQQLLASNSDAFLGQLQPSDVATLRTAQGLFQASIFLPAFLYHLCRLSDDPPRFPCTISWSIRKGAQPIPAPGHCLARWPCLRRRGRARAGVLHT